MTANANHFDGVNLACVCGFRTRRAWDAGRDCKHCGAAMARRDSTGPLARKGTTFPTYRQKLREAREAGRKRRGSGHGKMVVRCDSCGAVSFANERHECQRIAGR